MLILVVYHAKCVFMISIRSEMCIQACSQLAAECHDSTGSEGAHTESAPSYISLQPLRHPLSYEVLYAYLKSIHLPAVIEAVALRTLLLLHTITYKHQQCHKNQSNQHTEVHGTVVGPG